MCGDLVNDSNKWIKRERKKGRIRLMTVYSWCLSAIVNPSVAECQCKFNCHVAALKSNELKMVWCTSTVVGNQITNYEAGNRTSFTLGCMLKMRFCWKLFLARGFSPFLLHSYDWNGKWSLLVAWNSSQSVVHIVLVTSLPQPYSLWHIHFRCYDSTNIDIVNLYFLFNL